MKKSKVKNIFSVLIERIIEDELFMRAAAMTFYLMTTMAPLCLSILIILSFFDLNDFQGARKIINIFMSSTSNGPLELIFENLDQLDQYKKSNFINLVVLFFSSTLLFSSLQHSLNFIGRFREEKLNQSNFKLVLQYFKNKVIAFLLIIAMILYFFLSSLFTSVVAFFNEQFFYQISVAIDFGVNFIIRTGLFFFIYQILPSKRIKITRALMGASLCSLLLLVSQIFLNNYIQSKSTLSLYGTASSIIVVMFYTYYTCFIILLGYTFSSLLKEINE